MQYAGGALLLKQALSGVPSAPGSASAAWGYCEYSETSNAGFVELHPDRLLTQQQFYDALEKVPEVEKVAWKEDKTSQGNVGSHYMERNINVFVLGFASTPIEFELTRNQHMKDVSWRPYTLTACFKEPPKHLHHDAWRILMHVVKRKGVHALARRGLLQASTGQGGRVAAR